MNITDTVADRDLHALQAAIAGQIFVPGQASYDQARQAWNLALDERPAVSPAPCKRSKPPTTPTR